MDNINSLANQWATWMAGISWQLCVFVLALLLIDPLLRRRSATIRYGIWSLVLLRLVLPPTFALPTGWGWWTAEWTTSATNAAPLNTSRPATASAEASLPRAPRLSPRMLVLEPSQPQLQPMESGSAGATQTTWTAAIAAIARASGRVRHLFYDAAPMLLLIYLGMVCAQFGMLFSSSLQVRSWASKARLIIDPVIRQRFDECRERVGVATHVELRDSEACTTPLVVGFWRPVILIPSTILGKLTDDELAAVLTHELQHIRRRDGLVNLAQAILGVVYFFHPLLWLANGRIRALREDVCDEFTLNSLDSGPRPYGSALIKVAETLGYAAPPLAMGVLDGKTPLKQRMLRILDPRTASHNPWGIQAFVVTTLVALVLLPGGVPASGARWNLLSRFQRQSRVVREEGTQRSETRTETRSEPALIHLPRLIPAPQASTPEVGPNVYFHGDERHLQYLAEVEVDNGEFSQRFTGAVVYEVLAMNDKSLVTMYRPSLKQQVVSIDAPALAPGEPFLNSRWLTQDHPQAWSRRGVATPSDGPPLPLLHRSFASLLLPWLPDADETEVRENRSWSIERPSWLGAPDAGATRHPWGHLGAPPELRFPVGPHRPFPSIVPPWEHSSPKLHVSETRVARKLGADADGHLLVQESIQQKSQDGKFQLEGLITATLDPVRKLPLETKAQLVLSREENGQWIQLPIRITFIYVDVK